MSFGFRTGAVQAVLQDNPTTWLAEVTTAPNRNPSTGVPIFETQNWAPSLNLVFDVGAPGPPRTGTSSQDILVTFDEIGSFLDFDHSGRFYDPPTVFPRKSFRGGAATSNFATNQSRNEEGPQTLEVFGEVITVMHASLQLFEYCEWFHWHHQNVNGCSGGTTFQFCYNIEYSELFYKKNIVRTGFVPHCRSRVWGRCTPHSFLKVPNFHVKFRLSILFLKAQNCSFEGFRNHWNFENQSYKKNIFEVKITFHIF